MRGGTLDRRITIQRAQIIQDEAGEQVESWVSIITNRAARLAPLYGTERGGAPVPGAEQQVEFTIRWSQDVADISELDRIAYPASAATESPSLTKNIYDIVAVHEVGRRRGLRIIATRKPDVVAS